MILHLLVEGEEGSPVAASAVEGAWRLAEYLKGHLRRAHGGYVPPRTLEKARAVWQWITRNHKRTYKPRDVLSDLSLFKNAEEVLEAVAVLDERHHVRQMEAVRTSGPRGGRPPGRGAGTVSPGVQRPGPKGPPAGTPPVAMRGTGAGRMVPKYWL